ncbi:type IA DNA topoisomerase [Pampinifervens florentissimum]|uniref:type IA DNA topoisomerase n=1 Tax=Pampinifervens florentissimum TaxID=1632019 RepID=UPI0013B49DB2|nr:type IA DNA topoisomerase [Hydrogenobacter sp. T-8]QID33081.1 type IA DNA topoisomerase [Hydrogenobacter sp. T-8]
MKLILAEKPSVARDIAKALGGGKPKDGYIEAGEYVITWAMGHLLEIDDSIAPQKWEIASLPIFPERFSYRVKGQAQAKQLKVIRELLKKSQMVVIGTDMGREGEAIARLILIHCGWKDWDRTYRLWTSEALTPEVVRRELKNLKPAKDFDSLYQCAIARQHSDWIVGINLTRLVSIKANQGVWSVGRVQTPTLALVVKRDLEIENFKPEPYGVVKAIFSKEGQKYEATLVFKKELLRDKPDTAMDDDEEAKQGEDTAFRLSPEQAKKIVEELSREKTGEVLKVIKLKKSEPPPLLHSLTSLQREANRLYGFSASKTLSIAQSLYERGYISYPRTDAQHLAESSRDLVRKILKELGYQELAEKVDKAGKRVFDDSKLTDHYAIIPQKRGDDLAGDEKKIYELVKRKFIGAFMDSYEYELVKVFTRLGRYEFYSQGKTDLKLGWKSLYQEKEKETKLPHLREGDRVLKEDLKALTKFTQPPPHYTEATLLKVMEKLGLGTPATRASIIETLKERDYVRLKGKSLISTQKGKELVEKLRQSGSALVDAELTGKWEEELESIYKKKLGYRGYQDFVEKVKKLTLEEIEKLKGKSFERKTESVGSCPVCKKGQIQDFPKLFKCSECGVLVWKEFMGKKISSKDAIKLLEGKEVLLKGLKSKAGKKFDAKVRLENGRLKIVGF